jgi:guanylate kinase
VGRGTESAVQQQRRLETARAELAAQTEFDHVVVNREIGQAAEDLVALVRL